MRMRINLRCAIRVSLRYTVRMTLRSGVRRLPMALRRAGQLMSAVRRMRVRLRHAEHWMRGSLRAAIGMGMGSAVRRLHMGLRRAGRLRCADNGRFVRPAPAQVACLHMSLSNAGSRLLLNVIREVSFLVDILPTAFVN